MKIIALETWPVKMRLAEPYTIAYETIDSCTNVFLRIVTDRGPVGCGCAAPDAQVTGETPETVRRVCEDTFVPLLLKSDPLRIAVLTEKLKPLLADHPSAAAMVDVALYDILGKAAGIPVWKILGGFRNRIKTSITIGISSEAQTVSQARDFKLKGFKSIKIKGGKDVQLDIACLLYTSPSPRDKF